MRPAALSRTRAPAGSNPQQANPSAQSSLAAGLAISKHHFPTTPALRARARARTSQETKNTPMADDMSMNPSRDDFEALLDASMGGKDFSEGTVVKGRVAAI